jgi:hypothetical protein
MGKAINKMRFSLTTATYWWTICTIVLGLSVRWTECASDALLLLAWFMSAVLIWKQSWMASISYCIVVAVVMIAFAIRATAAAAAPANPGMMADHMAIACLWGTLAGGLMAGLAGLANGCENELRRRSLS